MAVIAHVDHGKTSLVNSMLAEAGLVHVKFGESGFTLDSMTGNPLEREKGVTILSKIIGLPVPKGVVERWAKDRGLSSADGREAQGGGSAATDLSKIIGMPMPKSEGVRLNMIDTPGMRILGARSSGYWGWRTGAC